MRERLDNDLYAAFRFAADIQPQPQHWLWPGRIPIGSLTLLIGDPGVGKSLLLADLAARVSTPHPWPDHTTNLKSQISNPQSPPAASTRQSSIVNRQSPAPPSLRGSVASSLSQGVILVCPEDGPADTLRPRLTAANANLASICILEGATHKLRSTFPPEPRTLNPEPSLIPFTLPAHADVLQEAIRAVDNPRLVILDPLHAILSPDDQTSIEAVTACLAETAHTYGVAIVAVGHLIKARSHRMLYRVRGSLTLVAAARAVHLLSVDPDDPHRRILSPVKMVYGPPPAPLAFRITPAPSLEWGTGGTGVPACEIGAIAPACTLNLPPDLVDLSPDARSALSEACDWLSDFLAAGPRPAREVLRQARAAGLSVGTVRRAKRILIVRAFKPALDSAWLWSQPQRPDNKGAQLGGARK